MQIVQEGEMSIASFFQDNDKDDRFTHANSNTIDFSDYPITDGNHYVFRNIEKSGCKSELQKLSQINACLHMALDNNVGSEKKSHTSTKKVQIMSKLGICPYGAEPTSIRMERYIRMLQLLL